MLSLKPTDKILLFESYPVFSHLSRDELMGIVEIASEMRFAGGSELFGEMAAPALYAIVSGLVVVETLDEKFPVSASDGDALGLYQMLSGIPLASRAFCASESLILRVERGDFLDLLLLRPELMRRILGSLFSSRRT
jgi:CRP-like cAMP-binding protein